MNIEFKEEDAPFHRAIIVEAFSDGAVLMDEFPSRFEEMSEKEKQLVVSSFLFLAGRYAKMWNVGPIGIGPDDREVAFVGSRVVTRAPIGLIGYNSHGEITKFEYDEIVDKNFAYVKFDNNMAAGFVPLIYLKLEEPEL